MAHPLWIHPNPNNIFNTKLVFSVKYVVFVLKLLLCPFIIKFYSVNFVTEQASDSFQQSSDNFRTPFFKGFIPSITNWTFACAFFFKLFIRGCVYVVTKCCQV